MTFKIDQCVKEFRSACLTIEHIAHGTDEIYSELRQNRLLSESNLKEIELLERHWKMIRKISERPVIIFVYGQSDEEKLRVLKEVLEVDLQINLNAIRSNNTKAKFVQVNHLADNDDTKIKDLFIQDELASNPQQLTSNALVLLSLHEPDEAFFDRMTNASSDRCSCLWLYTIARGSRTSLLLSGLRPFRNVTNPLLNDFAVVDTMLSFVEVIENSLKAKAMTAILPFKESLTQCLCVVLDILALMSADQRRTHLMLASAQEHENKLFQRLTDLVQRNQSQVAEVVRSAQMTARQNSKRIFQLAREPVSADEIERHVVHELNAVVTKELLKAADVFKQDYIGTLNRCLNDLCADTSKHATTISRSSSFNTNFSVTQAIASMYHIDLLSRF